MPQGFECWRGDLSGFVRDLKMRFAGWYNRRHGRDRHLWPQRFRSVLVEGGLAARTVADCIDLNVASKYHLKKT